MFKKKANPNKKVDLTQEAEQITTEPTPLPQPQPQPPIEGPASLEDQQNIANKAPLKSKPKSNLFSLEAYEKSEPAEKGKPNETAMTVEQERLVHSEIEECFSEFRRLKEEAVPYQQASREGISPFRHQQQQLQINQQNGNLNEQEQHWLEVEVDEEGGFSPEPCHEREDYNELEGDYEDELIRKTLSKHNYDSLASKGVNLKRMKQNDANELFLKKLKKVNAESIRKAISRDLYNKRLKLKEVNEGLREISTRGGSKRKEAEGKEGRLRGLREEMEKLNGVIEYIYYWGDRIKEVSMGGVLREMEEEAARKRNYNDDEF